MKAITLTQPWASLVAFRKKTLETRSWGTDYRGPLAIHASSVFSKSARELCQQEPFISALNSAYAEGLCPWEELLPFGQIIATSELVECIRIPTFQTRYISSFKLYNLFVYPNAQFQPMPGDHVVPIPPKGQELAFGDYSNGRFIWVLDRVHLIEKPVRVKGALRLWDWDVPIGIPQHGSLSYASGASVAQV